MTEATQHLSIVPDAVSDGAALDGAALDGALHGVSDEAEVRACFEAYEQALVDGDVEAMNEWFADDERTVRFGVAEEQLGAERIREWRRTTERVPAGRTLTGVEVVVWAPGCAVVSTMFRYPGSSALGRQSQTWLRTDAGWRVVHAHVSERQL